jgi:hypothetical protein
VPGADSHAPFGQKNIRSDPLDDRDIGLAATFAHGQEAVAAAGALQGVDQGGEQAGAGGAERVAEGDRAAGHVPGKMLEHVLF